MNDDRSDHICNNRIIKEVNMNNSGRINKKVTAAVLSSVIALTALCSSVPAAVSDAAGISTSYPSALKQATDPQITMSLVAGGSQIGVVYKLTTNGNLSDFTVKIDGEEQTADDTGKFTSAENSMDMLKEHTITVEKGGEVVAEKKASVKSYLWKIIENSDYSDYHALAKSMLMYGGASQTYFGKTSDGLASDDVEGADYANAKPDASPVDKDAFNALLEGSPVSYYGMNLSLRSKTTFTLYFKAAEGSTQAEAKEYLEGFTFGGSKASVKNNGASFLEVSTSVPATKLEEKLKLTNGSVTGSFSPAQYIAAAIEDGDEKLSDVCRALCAYGAAVKNVTGNAEIDDDEASQEPEWQLEPKGTVHSGDLTTYTLSGEGNAMLNDLVTDGMYAAMNTHDYNNAELAGACIEVTYNSKKVKVLVIDRLPEGAKGDIDLSPAAFEELTGLTTGRFDASWKIVPFESGNNISFKYKDGSSSSWMGVQARYGTYPVEKMEVEINGAYVEMERQEYNYYTVSGAGAGPYNFRLTDIYGDVVEAKNISFSLDEIQKSTVQFPK